MAVTSGTNRTLWPAALGTLFFYLYPSNTSLSYLSRFNAQPFEVNYNKHILFHLAFLIVSIRAGQYPVFVSMEMFLMYYIFYVNLLYIVI